jgi:hypothetical protein
MPEEVAKPVTNSPAPSGAPGRWVMRVSLPIPTSESGGGAAWVGRLHIIGGFGEGRVNRTYHHIYEPGGDRWFRATPLHGPEHEPSRRRLRLRGFGRPLEVCRAIAARAGRAGGAAILDGHIHLLGGAAAPKDERASVAWHKVYDPKADTWS